MAKKRFYVYDKDGNAFGMNNKIDVRMALKTGNYTIKPPGAEEEPEKPIPPEGEVVEGVSSESEEEKAEKDIKERKGFSPNVTTETSSGRKIKAKKE